MLSGKHIVVLPKRSSSNSLCPSEQFRKNRLGTIVVQSIKTIRQLYHSLLYRWSRLRTGIKQLSDHRSQLKWKNIWKKDIWYGTCWKYCWLLRQLPQSSCAFYTCWFRRHPLPKTPQNWYRLYPFSAFPFPYRMPINSSKSWKKKIVSLRYTPLGTIPSSHPDLSFHHPICEYRRYRQCRLWFHVQQSCSGKSIHHPCPMDSFSILNLIRFSKIKR